MVRPLVHVFEHRGDRFFFDVHTSQVVKVDTPAYDVLLLYRDRPDDWQYIRSQLKDKHPPEVLDSVAAGIEQLKKGGLLQQDPPESDEDIDRYIQSFMARPPSGITLTLSETCNLRCRYCYVDEDVREAPRKFMTRETAKRAIDFFFDRSKGVKDVSITFFGGEPLLNMDVLEYSIAYSEDIGKKLGKQVTYITTTNGTTINRRAIDLIKGYNFGLMVSMDGPEAAHDAMRVFPNGNGSFERASAGIKQLMRRRRRVTVRATMCKYNRDLLELIRFFEDFGYSRIALSFCHGKSYRKEWYDMDRGDLDYLYRQFDVAMERAFERLKEGKPLQYNPFSQSIYNLHHKKTNRIRCGICRGTTTVSVDGCFYPCHRYLGMEAYRFGDIDDGIDAEKVERILRGYYATKNDCESCWLVKACGGACPWYCSHEDGHCVPPDQDYHCDNIRRAYERMIYYYNRIREELPEDFDKIVNPERYRKAANQKADPLGDPRKQPLFEDCATPS